MPLTKRQREILNYLATYTEQNGYAPSFEEIAESFRYSSLATVHEHLSNLERKGYIKRSYNESRAIEIAQVFVNRRQRVIVELSRDLLEARRVPVFGGVAGEIVENLALALGERHGDGSGSR